MSPKLNPKSKLGRAMVKGLTLELLLRASRDHLAEDVRKLRRRIRALDAAIAQAGKV